MSYNWLLPDGGPSHAPTDGQVEVLTGVVAAQGAHPWTGTRASCYLPVFTSFSNAVS